MLSGPFLYIMVIVLMEALTFEISLGLLIIFTLCTLPSTLVQQLRIGSELSGKVPPYLEPELNHMSTNAKQTVRKQSGNQSFTNRTNKGTEGEQSPLLQAPADQV